MAKIGKKPMIICCCVMLFIILIVIAVLVILYFTVFRPRAPRVVATPVDVQLTAFNALPPVLNISLGVDIVVNNPNYADFKYGETTTAITYHGLPVGEAPIQAGRINARATSRISTRVDIDALKVITSGFFALDVLSGELTFASSSAVDGKATVLGAFKLHAQAQVMCRINVHVFTGQSSSDCTSTVQV